MTRKDYELLTDALAKAYNMSQSVIGTKTSGVALAIVCISDALQANNKAFDPGMFTANIAADTVIEQDTEEQKKLAAVAYLESQGYSVQVMQPDMEW
jgi:hypothetical protein